MKWLSIAVVARHLSSERLDSVPPAVASMGRAGLRFRDSRERAIQSGMFSQPFLHYVRTELFVSVCLCIWISSHVHSLGRDLGKFILT